MQATGFEVTPGVWLGAALGVIIVGIGTLIRMNFTLRDRSGRMLQTLYGDEKTPGLVKDVEDMKDEVTTTRSDMALTKHTMESMERRHEEMAKNLGAILRGEGPFKPWRGRS